MAYRSVQVAPIPDAENDIRQEAMSLGLMEPPTFEKIVNRQSTLTPRQSLLRCIHDTSKLKRSTKQAFVLLVGSTGSGKSSTINHLFDLKDDNRLRAETSSEESQTKHVQEYILKTDYPKYDLQDATLSVIDTPGFNDTEGHEQDLRNLNAIQRFFDKHPSLKGRKPNLVFVFVNATDNRFLGQHSMFQNSLRFIKNLKIVSRKHPNVVGIITHACSLGPPPYHMDPQSWLTNLNKKAETLRDIMHQTLNIVSPIVCIENEHEQYYLDQIGEFSLLPCEDKPQLVNLLKSSLDVLQKSKDSLAEIIFDACFLSNVECQVRKELGLNVLAGEMTDIERSRLKDIEEYQSQTLTSGATSLRKVMLLNHGYDLFSDGETDKEIFKTNTTHSEFGWLLPEKFTIQKYNRTFHVMEMYDSENAFNKELLQEFGIEVDADLSAIALKLRPGCNTEESVKDGVYRYMTMHILYSLSIDDYENELTDEFKEAIRNLPSNYSETVGCAPFLDFFTEWGHCTVTSVLIGGALSAHVRSRSSNGTTSFQEVKDRLFPYLEFNTSVNNEEDFNQGSITFEKRDLHVEDMEWTGGNKRYHNDKTVKEKGFWQAWLDSVKFEPEVLDRKLKLVPMSDIIKLVDPKKGEAVESALKAMFQSIEAEKISTLTLKDYKEKDDSRKVLPFHQPQPRINCQILPQNEQNEIQSSNIPRTRTEAVEQNETQHEKDSCFSLDSQVQIIDSVGSKRRICLKDLNVNDRVLSWSFKKRTLLYSPVIAFLDYSDNRRVKFLKITLKNASEISITGNHFLLLHQNMQTIPARNLTIGDLIWTQDENMRLTESEVIKIEAEDRMGFVAPLTKSGTIIVDNMLASCYCNVRDIQLTNKIKISAQRIAHFAMAPLRLSHGFSSSKKKKSVCRKSMHPYVAWLRNAANRANMEH